LPRLQRSVLMDRIFRMKCLFPCFAAALAAVSLLTYCHAPDWKWTWKLAILSGEFGHWLVVLPLGLIVIAWLALPGAPRCVTLALCMVAIAGFLRPVFSARRLAGPLPGEMRAAFSGGNPVQSAFSFGRLFHRPNPETVGVTTEVFARPAGQELKLDFYTPLRVMVESHPDRGPSPPPPCLVVIHGGGWDSGDRLQLAEWNHHWARNGYAVAAISYRLAPRWIWPAQRDDVLAAIAWLKAHADDLGIDPTRLILLGRSAGGQIATAVGYGANDPAIRGVIALYSPHDMPFTWSVSREDDSLNSVNLLRQLFGGPLDDGRRALYESASGQLLAHAGSPPALLIHGANDTLSWYRHSERMAERLKELRVPHYFLRLPWATHGFDFNPNGPGGQLANYAIDQFVQSVTR